MTHPTRRRAQWARAASWLLSAIVFAATPGVGAAQNIISVPFNQGFFGKRGSSAASTDSIRTFATLGISRIFFIQSSSTTTFELQGNDIPGTMRIVRTNGTTVDLPASANWRNNGGTTFLIGILPRPVSPITWTYSGGSIQITDGSVTGGTNVGAYIAGYTGTIASDGSSYSGNAATNGLLSALNTYLATVVQSRPAGPVTVTAQSTSDDTPTLTGSATLAGGESLTIVVNGVQYSTTSSPAIVLNGTSWSLTLTTPLPAGTYDVAATITDADGFTLSDTSINELTIAPAVTIGGSFTAADKPYSGTTVATGNTAGLTLSGVASGHTVSIVSVTLAFGTAAVGSGKTVSITGVTLGGTHAALYTVQLAGAPTATASITPRALTISGVSAQNKVYDGNSSASLSGTAGYVGLQNGESFAVAGSPTATFASPNVGSGIAVTVNGYTAPNDNYSVTQPADLTANITRKTLGFTGGFVADDKLYDGTTAATSSSNTLALTGIESGSDVSIGSFTTVFLSAGVGTGKTVRINGLTLAGADAGNYQVDLATAPTSTASITSSGPVVTITGSFTANDKVYNGRRAATGNTAGLSLAGVADGHIVTIASVGLSFQTAGAGDDKTVEITSVTLEGADAASYSVDLTGAPTATANITPKPLTISGIAAENKRYDRGTTASLTGAPSYEGLENSESFTVTGTPSASFASSSVADDKAVTVTGFAAPSANYTVTQPTGLTADITPVTLTISGSFTANNKVYDGTTSATIATSSLSLAGVLTGDIVTLGDVSVVFGTATVGNDKAVSIASSATLQGTAAANYVISYVGAPTTTADITSAGGVLSLGGSFTATDKVYDGVLTASGNAAGLTIAGVSGSDQVSIAGVTLAFENATVGIGKRVVIAAVTLAGAHASLYTVNLATAPTALANITPRVVTIGGSFGALDKLFDGTRTATLTDDALFVVGALAGDVLTLSNVVVTFAEELVGNRIVNITSAMLQGANAANYQLALTGAPTTAANIAALDPPGAPRNLAGTPGDGRLTVSFTMPLVEGCRPVDRFLIEYSADNGVTWTRRTVESRAASPYEIAPVTNNVTYRVRVAAANTCGMGPFTQIDGLTPIAPAHDGDGTVRRNTPGTTTVTSNGTTVPVTITVVEDTTVRIASPDFTIAIRSVDTTGAPVPAEGLVLQLEQGGTAYTSGTGFGPGTWVSIYVYGESGVPRFLGKVLVNADGSFATSFPVPGDLAAGSYTLQVNGVDAALQPRNATLGVEVIEPVAEPVLLAVPDRTDMTVGDTVTFTLTVTNGGRGAAVDVVIPRAFDEPGFRFVNAAPADGTFDAPTLTWTIPRIAAGGTARLTLRAVVLPPSAEPTTAATGGAPR